MEERAHGKESVYVVRYEGSSNIKAMIEGKEKAGLYFSIYARCTWN
jgi:hypothetical protein